MGTKSNRDFSFLNSMNIEELCKYKWKHSTVKDKFQELAIRYVIADKTLMKYRMLEDGLSEEDAESIYVRDAVSLTEDFLEAHYDMSCAAHKRRRLCIECLRFDFDTAYMWFMLAAAIIGFLIMLIGAWKVITLV